MKKPEKLHLYIGAFIRTLYSRVHHLILAVITVTNRDRRTEPEKLNRLEFGLLGVLGIVGLWCAIAYWFPPNWGRFSDRPMHNYPYPFNSHREQVK